MFPTAVSLCAPPTLSCACNYLCFLFFLSACQALGLYCKYKDFSLPLLDSPPHTHTRTRAHASLYPWMTLFRLWTLLHVAASSSFGLLLWNLPSVWGRTCQSVFKQLPLRWRTHVRKIDFSVCKHGYWYSALMRNAGPSWQSSWFKSKTK